jgi:ribosomal protein S18 acetylase RimI-like enzyme
MRNPRGARVAVGYGETVCLGALPCAEGPFGGAVGDSIGKSNGRRLGFDVMSPSAPRHGHGSAAGFREFVESDGPLLAEWLELAGLRVPSDLAAGKCDRLCTDPRIALRVATDAEGAVLGFSRLDLAPDNTAEITLIVSPGYRGRGIGRGLLQDALEAGRHRGLRRVFAVIEEDNVVAQGFFFSAGFERTGVWMAGYVHLHRILHRSHADPEPLDIDP